ncbi:MAG: hypothetical protein AAB863_01210 [Patescibacteria group bacterium]
MNTIGELIDSLQNSGESCVFWLSMICDNTDPSTLAQFRALEITEHNVSVFCQTIAAQIHRYLVGVSTEARFESTLQEGRALFRLVYERVKDKGIPERSVYVPISYVDIAVQSGIIEVNDGMVSLTEAGREAARKFESFE